VFRSRNLIIFLLWTNSILFAQNNYDMPLHDRELVSIDLGWTENIEITIEEVVFKKDIYPKREIGEVVDINIEALKDFFLEKAVIVSGIEISYSFLYEHIIVSGKLVTECGEYRYSYNMAGFCYLYNGQEEDPLIIADPDMEITL